MIIKDLDILGYNRVVVRCDNEPSILALLRAVKLAWTGDVVQETSAEVTRNPTVLQKVQYKSSMDMPDRSNWQWSQLRVSKCQQTMIC